MPNETVLYEVKGRIAYIALNRPEKLNALNAAMLEELAAAFERFDQDRDAWVALVSGTGRSFCVGRDVRMFQDNLDGVARTPSRKVGPPFLGPVRSGKPVIGALHGHVFGLGLMLAGECDLLVATPDAQFGAAEVKRSLSGAGVWARLSQWIPGKIMAEMALTGEPISGAEAFRLGLVNRIVPRENLLPEAELLAERLVALPPLAVRATVQAIRGAAAAAIQERSTHAPAIALNQTEDYKEAIASFLEKRPPVYRGQ